MFLHLCDACNIVCNFIIMRSRCDTIGPLLLSGFVQFVCIIGLVGDTNMHINTG